MFIRASKMINIILSSGIYGKLVFASLLQGGLLWQRGQSIYNKR